MIALLLAAHGTFGYDEIEPYVIPIRQLGIFLFGSRRNLQVSERGVGTHDCDTAIHTPFIQNVLVPIGLLTLSMHRREI